MKPTFDLVAEGWIPCLMPTGEVREVGLLEALAEAHNFTEITDSSPPIVASLHRLLLAILHRNFGPANVRAWRDLWRAGAFDRGALEGYFQKWRHRFDLFDAERPFYQVAGLETSMQKSTAEVCLQAAAGNNAVLFDHSTDEVPVRLAPPVAARNLVAVQGFHYKNICSGPGKSGKCYPTAAPLVAGMTVLAMGTSLFETLALNMVVYSPEDDVPLPCRGDGPVWEKDAAAAVETVQPSGYLDYLTWQSRCIWLEPTQSLQVGSAIVTDGRRFAEGYHLREDPMMAYQRREKSKANENPCPALKFSESRVLWRDSMALLQSIPNKRWRPAVLGHLADRVEDGTIPAVTVYNIAAIGLCSDRAKVMFWRHERQPLPLQYLTNPDLVADLGTALELAEGGDWAMREWADALAEELCPPDRDRKGGTPQKRLDDLRRGCKAAAQTLYWSSLESAFYDLVQRMAAPEAEREALKMSWATLALAQARRAAGEAAQGLRRDGRMLRALCKAQNALNRTLRHEFGDYYPADEEVNHDEAESEAYAVR